MTEIEAEKVWEKPWSPNDLVSNSTNWTLAGDAGLLLNLKKFSENFMSKAVNIEKELQKLVFEEQQCHVKFENVRSQFLQLENSQFIENRVYEQDVSDLIKPIEEKPEKTKEEKEQELYEIITESVQIGMGIMDTYFDRIDGVDDDESDDEGQEKNDDLVIYETKDPYVLRSLPYLIGSEAYLENDHVGLKDLEEEDDEEEEVEPEPESESESEEVQSKSEESEESEEELFTQPQKENLFDSKSDNEKNDIFSSTKKNDNLFDDESEQESEEEVIDTKPVEAKPVVLDFASELSRKLAAKANKESKPEEAPPKPIKIESEDENPKKSLFDDDEEEDTLFKSVKPSPSSKKGLFDDADDEEEIFVPKPPVKTNLFKDEVAKKVDPVPPPVKQTLFEDSEDEFSNPEPVKIEPVKVPVVKNTLFDDDEEDDLFAKPVDKKSEPVLPTVSKPTLFDDEEDLFEKPVHKTEPKPVKSSLFDDDSEDDLFSKPVEKKPQVQPPIESVTPLVKEVEKKQEPPVIKQSLFDDEDEDDLFSKPPRPAPPPPVKQSLFDDDDEDDLFMTKKVEPKKPDEVKVEEEPKAEEEEEIKKPKLIVKNVLFDPKALKSSNLFKKIAQVNSESEDEWEDKKEEKVVKDFSDPFSEFVPQNKPIETQSEKEKSPDIFQNLQTQAPIVNSAQKDRIKAARKRAPPTQRKQTLDETNSITPSIPDKVQDVDLKIDETVIKPKSSILFDNDDDDDIFKVDVKAKVEKKVEPKKQETQKEPIKSLFDDFDDDDDIFNVKPKSKKEEKKSEPVKSDVKKPSVFDELDDDEDIFAIAPKKKIEKKIQFDESIFDDPLSSFK